MSEFINKKISFQNAKLSVKIFRKLYHNTNSKIFQCHDVTNQNKSFCLKIIQARLDDKAQISSINSEIIVMGCPFNVQIIDYYCEEKFGCASFFILMEFCGSKILNLDGNLQEVIRKMANEKNSFTEPQIWKIIHEVASALSALHSLKYAHRDLKMDNVLISLDGKYKLADYGSSTNKFYETVNNSNRNEIAFEISRIIAPEIRSPEQVDLYSGNPLNEKVDIWALGVILYKLLFDSDPFPEGSRLNFIKGNFIMNDEMANQCNPLLIELLKAMMQPNPKNRISAEDILFFIQKNWEEINKQYNNLSLNKRSPTLKKRLSDSISKVFKRHSTQ